MSGIFEEFGEERVQDIVGKIKTLEKVGVFRILPFIRKNSKYYSQVDAVMSLHAFKEAAMILEKIDWVRIEKRDGRHYYTLTPIGEEVTDLLLEILSRIP
ncbi:MAG: hypothetical protein ACTSUO_09930 [Candidatus Thorarchaeota archaeon]